MSCPSGRPCSLHDRPETWKIEERQRDPMSAVWLVVILFIVLAVSTLPGLN
jgi:hypothetical protein